MEAESFHSMSGGALSPPGGAPKPGSSGLVSAAYTAYSTPISTTSRAADLSVFTIVLLDESPSGAPWLRRMRKGGKTSCAANHKPLSGKQPDQLGHCCHAPGENLQSAASCFEHFPR